MKYLINNSQKKHFLSKWINELKDECSISKFDNFIVLSKEDETDWSDVFIEYDFEDGRLYIDKEFVFDNITSWVPLDINVISDFIKNWFEEEFKVEVKYVEH